MFVSVNKRNYNVCLPIGIYLYLNALNNDMSIKILLILKGLHISMISRLKCIQYVYKYITTFYIFE